jgi:ketosteroid isomerase-like protein
LSPNGILRFMKPVIALSALVFLVTGIAQATDEKTLGLEKQVLAVEHSWLDAVKKADVNALQGILRDDYINLDPTGQIQNKVDTLKLTDEMSSNPKKAEAAALSITAVRVRFYGDVAVLTGAASVGGSKMTGIRFAHIWVKSGDQWLLSTSQSTKIAPLPNTPHAPVKIDRTPSR